MHRCERGGLRNIGWLVRWQSCSVSGPNWVEHGPLNPIRSDHGRHRTRLMQIKWAACQRVDGNAPQLVLGLRLLPVHAAASSRSDPVRAAALAPPSVQAECGRNRGRVMCGSALGERSWLDRIAKIRTPYENADAGLANAYSRSTDLASASSFARSRISSSRRSTCTNFSSWNRRSTRLTVSGARRR